MFYLLTAVHILVCFFLILVVLLQRGKGADLAGAFGGSSQTAFGARGATTLLSKLTTGSVIVFMLTSFSLAMMANRYRSSVVTDEPEPQSVPGQSIPAPMDRIPPPDATPDSSSPDDPQIVPGEVEEPEDGADADANTP